MIIVDLCDMEDAFLKKINAASAMASEYALAYVDCGDEKARNLSLAFTRDASIWQEASKMASEFRSMIGNRAVEAYKKTVPVEGDSNG